MKTYLIVALLIAAAVTPVSAQSPKASGTFTAPAGPTQPRHRPPPPISTETDGGWCDPACHSRREPASDAQSESAPQIRDIPGSSELRSG